MKNLKLIKIFLVVAVSLCLVFVATSVFAADDDGFVDLTDTIGSNNTNNAVDEDVNNTNTLNDISATNNTTNTTNTNITNYTSNTNSSSYNNTNTNLPSTGIGESGSIIALIVVLAISGVYAYKKVMDYKNV